MRINLARTNKSLKGLFFEQTLREFANEFSFASYKAAAQYVCTGKQGLQSYVEYLQAIGYKAEMFFLPPNKDLFINIGEEWTNVSRWSPSFGIIIPDDDLQLVEFKLRNT